MGRDRPNGTTGKRELKEGRCPAPKKDILCSLPSPTATAHEPRPPRFGIGRDVYIVYSADKKDYTKEFTELSVSRPASPAAAKGGMKWKGGRELSNLPQAKFPLNEGSEGG